MPSKGKDEWKSSTPFTYYRDPLLLLSWAAYGINRFCIKPFVPRDSHLIHDWFQDFLLIPALLPIVLWGFRKLDLRKGDRFPTWAEILIHTVWWSFFFEIFGPRVLHKGTSDPGDAIAYFIGGILSGLLWHHVEKKIKDVEQKPFW